MARVEAEGKVGRTLHTGTFRRALGIVAVSAAVGLGGCGVDYVEATQDGGAGTGGCVVCGTNCFECGGGCECGRHDASVQQNPWTSPFPNTGADGTWKGSAATFCPHATGIEAFDLWSDARGVYALIAGSDAVAVADNADAGPPVAGSSGGAQPPIAGASGDAAGAGGFAGSAGGGGFGGGIVTSPCGNNACVGETILFNDGVAGWQRIYERRESAAFSERRLSGVTGGPLVLNGRVDPFNGASGCSLGRLDGADWSCDRAGGTVGAFYAVHSTLAYAAADGNLIAFDGADWSVLDPAAPGQVASSWSDGTTLIAIDNNGAVSQLRNGVWTNPFGGLWAQSVWGNAADDLWFIGHPSSADPLERELMHFDGSATTVVATLGVEPCGDGDFSMRLWGHGDALYVYGDRSLRRWNGTELTTLANWICDFQRSARITRVWGNGPDEVFVALMDFARPSFTACGQGVVMYFDGAQFHEL